VEFILRIPFPKYEFPISDITGRSNGRIRTSVSLHSTFSQQIFHGL